MWLSSGWVLAGLGFLLLWLVVLPMAVAHDWIRGRMKEATRTRWKRRMDAFNRAIIVVYAVVIAVMVLYAVLQQFAR